jgi:hypothetical protein
VSNLRLELRVVGAQRQTHITQPRVLASVSTVGGRGLRGDPGPANLYIGPALGAPAAVDAPLLMVLREPGAPAGQTSLVVREPNG